jgi:hypothetical protein
MALLSFTTGQHCLGGLCCFLYLWPVCYPVKCQNQDGEDQGRVSGDE